MNNFKKQKQYSSCKCMYITKMQCTDEVLKNDVISRLNLYLHLYHVQKFVLVKCPELFVTRTKFCFSSDSVPLEITADCHAWSAIHPSLWRPV